MTRLTRSLTLTDTMSYKITNSTIVLDLATWFVDAQGNLIDPNSANKGGDNENLVKDNIKASIEAFEDSDKDGSEG